MTKPISSSVEGRKKERKSKERRTGREREKRRQVLWPMNGKMKKNTNLKISGSNIVSPGWLCYSCCNFCCCCHGCTVRLAPFYSRPVSATIMQISIENNKRRRREEKKYANDLKLMCIQNWILRAFFSRSIRSDLFVHSGLSDVISCNKQRAHNCHITWCCAYNENGKCFRESSL